MAAIFGLITRVPPAAEHGNLCLDHNVFVDPQAFGRPYDDDATPFIDVLTDPEQRFILALMLRTPLFKVGEILILTSDGRDQFGRKPGKWNVECETFGDDVAALLRRLAEVEGLTP